MMTPRQREILQMLVDEEDIFWDGGREVWIGIERTNVAMIYRLLNRMWIKQDSQSLNSPYWMITHRGREALQKESVC